MAPTDVFHSLSKVQPHAHSLEEEEFVVDGDAGSAVRGFQAHCADVVCWKLTRSYHRRYQYRHLAGQVDLTDIKRILLKDSLGIGQVRGNQGRREDAGIVFKFGYGRQRRHIVVVDGTIVELPVVDIWPVTSPSRPTKMQCRKPDRGPKSRWRSKCERPVHSFRVVA